MVANRGINEYSAFQPQAIVPLPILAPSDQLCGTIEPASHEPDLSARKTYPCNPVKAIKGIECTVLDGELLLILFACTIVCSLNCSETGGVPVAIQHSGTLMTFPNADTSDGY